MVNSKSKQKRNGKEKISPLFEFHDLLALMTPLRKETQLSVMQSTKKPGHAVSMYPVKEQGEAEIKITRSFTKSLTPLIDDLSQSLKEQPSFSLYIYRQNATQLLVQF